MLMTAFILLSILVFLLLIGNYVMNQRYLKKKTSQTMRPEVWNEIENEMNAALARRNKFKITLEQVQQKSHRELADNGEDQNL
ncbi:MAG: hypothetical protein HY540_03065 [Deltaproteobacteria bacterium]|nr:hypothetical protein [Deltaproteobacteria bacterium]